ncbi:MAG TPA: right-handed parallel beta-helix repeat-containing protein, partial [Candidatus Saccharimonadales bacterium]|nr:right-handed parallel beta-helix repeat-containing protein [Candidatus Saccharimonadales bacterium]
MTRSKAQSCNANRGLTKAGWEHACKFSRNSAERKLACPAGKFWWCWMVVVMTSCARVANGDTFDVINGNDTGAGSLRWAISNANLSTGPHLIQFRIPTNTVQVIRPVQPLPALEQAMVLDGYTQSNASPKTASEAAVIRVELDGSGAGVLANGLEIRASSCTIRGLAINRFGGTGIQITDGSSNIIRGNFIGLAADGATIQPNEFEGVWIKQGTGNEIGGTAPEAGNVISGNQSSGILISADGNVVRGNFIGLIATGTAEAGNGLDGITIEGATNVVGGTLPGARNVISGNLTAGVYLTGSATMNVVAGNFVGPAAGGTNALGNFFGIAIEGMGNRIGGPEVGSGNLISGNSYTGIFVDGTGASNNVIAGNWIGTDAMRRPTLGNAKAGILLAASGNLIGGLSAGAANVVAGNRSNGVTVINTNLSGDAILGNSIFANIGLGIDLGNDGPTPNDPNDADAGPNGRQNYPVTNSAESGGTGTGVTGMLQSAPNTMYR